MRCQRPFIFLLVCSSFLVQVSQARRVGLRRGYNETSKGRKGKFLSVFQVIRFANDECIGSAGNKNGTCFTEQECQAKGGDNGGSCAQGFGVCCIVTLDCGQTSSENCTYFESSSPMAGSCVATICPCNDNICQLRLDFTLFTATGPSRDAVAIAKRIAKSGVVGPAGTIPVTGVTQCLTDTFSVTNRDGPSPPVICGVNTVYVDSNDECNDLVFQFGQMPVGVDAIANRQWSIKVTQFSCNFANLAPSGCVQYFFGSQVQNFQTYNYNSGAGLHLANQDQQICIRRERQFCRICYYPLMNTDFDVSGSADGKRSNSGNLCCSYDVPATKKFGFDCVHIPGAIKKSGINPFPVKSNYCGNSGFASGVGGGPTTVCSVTTPFSVLFRSDAYEVPLEAARLNPGFLLQYKMDAQGCVPVP